MPVESENVTGSASGVQAESAELVHAAQVVLAHAWVVRAFVRHSDEAEDFPELTEIGRAVFDLSRALETRVEDPVGYFKMLSKKLGKFRKAAEKFGVDAPQASAHTNFQQAVVAIQDCGVQLERLQERYQSLVGRAGGASAESQLS